MSLTIGSLFSGSGMLDEAVRAHFGGEVAWHCEHEPATEKNPRPTQAAARLLAYRYPGVPNLGDITAVDWSTVEPVDVLTGGFPCQDVSHAGKRAGMREGTRSGLWARMRDAIDQLRPAVVVAENVRGLLSAEADSGVVTGERLLVRGSRRARLRALGRVLGDLAELGYDCRVHGLRAADVGAPHGRFRIFILATDAQRLGCDGWPHDAGRQPAAGRGSTADGDGDGLAQLGWQLAEQPDVDRCGSQDIAWGVYEPAIRRWERVLGRPAPAPAETGPKGGQRLSPRLTEWMMGWPEGWVTDVPGITRNETLRICGNGVVPQQALAALDRLAAIEVAA